MKGVITGRDVFRHAFTIIRCWGTPTFARCLWAVLTRRTTTFLTVIYEGERYPTSLHDHPGEGKTEPPRDANPA
ncbi:MAG TPA: hypothetical protein VE782_03190 [Myxococcaceae bacterium]|jgi:hypothetical protein|nr:hypothetical protein [Myxococcaceae bacterium]